MEEKFSTEKMTEAISKATPLIEPNSNSNSNTNDPIIHGDDIMINPDDKEAPCEDDSEQLHIESVITSEEKKEDESRAMIDTDQPPETAEANFTPQIDGKDGFDAETDDTMPGAYDYLSDTAVASYPSNDEDQNHPNIEDESAEEILRSTEIGDSPSKNIDLTCAAMEVTPSEDEQSIKTSNENKETKQILSEAVIEASSSRNDALTNAVAMEDSPSKHGVGEMHVGVSHSMDESTVYSDLESKSFESLLGNSDVKSPLSEKENPAIDMAKSPDSEKENVSDTNLKMKRITHQKVASTPTSQGTTSQRSPTFMMRTFGSSKSPRNMDIAYSTTTSTVSAKEEEMQYQVSPANTKTKTDLVVKISEERYRLTQEVQKLQEELEALNATNKELKDIYEKVNSKNEQDEYLIQDLLNEKEALREELKVTKVSVAELSSDLIQRDSTIRKQTKQADKEKIKFQSILEKNQTLQMEKAALQEELRDTRKSFEKETKQVSTLTSQLNRTKKSLDETEKLKDTLKESLRESMTERNDMKKELASLSRDKYKLERQVADLAKDIESSPMSQQKSGIRWFSSSSLTTPLSSSNTNSMSRSLPLAKIDSKILSRNSTSEVRTEIPEKQKSVKKSTNRALFSESPLKRRGFSGLFGGTLKDEAAKPRINKIPDVFNSSSHDSSSTNVTDVDTKNSNRTRIISRTGLVRQRNDNKTPTTLDDNVNQLRSTEKKPATRRSFKAFSSSSKSSYRGESKNPKSVSCMSIQNVEDLREELKEERMFERSENKSAPTPKTEEIFERPPRPTTSSVANQNEKKSHDMIWNTGNASLNPAPTHVNSIKKLSIVSSSPTEGKILESERNNSVSTAMTLPEDSD